MNKSKIVSISAMIATLTLIHTFLEHFGIVGTLNGSFYCSSHYIIDSIVSASPQETTTFILRGLLDIFLVIPLYTLCLFHVFDMVMYNFRISPFKALVLFPALMDFTGNLVLLLNNALFKSAPMFSNFVAILIYFKWTLGIVLILIVIIFLLAKLLGVTGTIKIISYDDLWSNKKNVRIYWTWIFGHVLTTIVSILFIVLYMLNHSVHPLLSLKWGVISFLFALLYDFIFNIFLKIPAHIFDKTYNHWLRTVFISSDSIFLMSALGMAAMKT